jgi:hypothetical protein
MLAAFRVPLAAQYPQPAESHAVRLMLAAQFAALAVLYPWLMRTWAAAAAVLAAAWVMLSMAALLSAWALADSLLLSIFLTVWIADFALLSRIRSFRWQMVVVAIACAHVIGGPLLWYFQLEFASPSPGGPGIAFGPMLVALSTPRHLPPPAWIEAIAVGIVATVVCNIVRRIPQNSI